MFLASSMASQVSGKGGESLEMSSVTIESRIRSLQSRSWPVCSTPRFRKASCKKGQTRAPVFVVIWRKSWFMGGME